MLFGIGFSGEINSYAASFGTVSVNAELPEYVKDALRHMTAISVRDEKSADLVKKITGVKPCVVFRSNVVMEFR